MKQYSNETWSDSIDVEKELGFYMVYKGILHDSAFTAILFSIALAIGKVL